ncbi:phage head-tail connector protein, partial [Devosia sp.]|uniref:phage head-tail connector protein n=1 Tax=Devosia sp. TaxID=1871048 RepID=UPI001AD28329
MWYPAKVKTPGPSEPVAADAARRQCGLAADDASHDGQLNLLIGAARAHIEKYCGIRLPVQILTVPCDGFFDLARVPEAPVKSVVEIRYVDGEGAAQVVAPAVYQLRPDGLRPSIALVHGKRWPSLQPGARVEVELSVGYDSIPKDLEAALLLMVGAQFGFARSDLLKRREDVEGIGSTQWGGIVEVNNAVKSMVETLLENYRCW